MAASLMMTTVMAEQPPSSPGSPSEQKSKRSEKDLFRKTARVAPASIPGVSGVRHRDVSGKPDGKSWELAPGQGFTKTKLELRSLQRHRYLIDPHRTPWVQKWDVCMMFALTFTVVVTPVEVAYLDEGSYINFLFCLNRVVDIIFIFDLLLTFNLAYQMEPGKGGHFVFNRWMIARRYLTGWFVIDLFSVLPFFFITLDYGDLFGADAIGNSTTSGRINADERIRPAVTMTAGREEEECEVVIVAFLLSSASC